MTFYSILYSISLFMQLKSILIPVSAGTTVLAGWRCCAHNAESDKTNKDQEERKSFQILEITSHF